MGSGAGAVGVARGASSSGAWCAFRGRGVHQPGHATMPEFRGTEGSTIKGAELAEGKPESLEGPRTCAMS